MIILGGQLPPSAREVAKSRQVLMVTVPERFPAEAEWAARWQVASAAERSRITLGDIDVLLEQRRAAS